MKLPSYEFPKSSFLSMEKDLSIIFNTLIKNDNLKKYLLNKSVYMKRIHITESQLEDVLKLKETINQTIDRKPGESIDNAVKNAAREVKQDAPSADVNFVISGDEVNEDANGGVSVPQQVVDFILNNSSI